MCMRLLEWKLCVFFWPAGVEFSSMSTLGCVATTERSTTPQTREKKKPTHAVMMCMSASSLHFFFQNWIWAAHLRRFIQLVDMLSRSPAVADVVTPTCWGRKERRVVKSRLVWVRLPLLKIGPRVACPVWHGKVLFWQKQKDALRQSQVHSSFMNVTSQGDSRSFSAFSFLLFCSGELFIHSLNHNKLVPWGRSDPALYEVKDTAVNPAKKYVTCKSHSMFHYFKE